MTPGTGRHDSARRDVGHRQKPRLFAGRTEEAVREMQAALALARNLDVSPAGSRSWKPGDVCRDRPSRAMAALRDLMNGVSRLSPNEIRPRSALVAAEGRPAVRRSVNRRRRFGSPRLPAAIAAMRSAASAGWAPSLQARGWAVRSARPALVMKRDER